MSGLTSRLRQAADLDQYYTCTRYPNGLPDTVPHECYEQEHADRFIGHARPLLSFVRSLLAPPTSWPRASRRNLARRVILHPSLARGKIHRHSDIDLVVIWNTDLGFFDRIGRVLDLAPEHIAAEVMMYTPSEGNRMAGGPFRECVDRDGVELPASPAQCASG